ncbi:HNH endonuclease, partial [Kocuria rosea]|nr:HNH endonuclease [Kocuria rosea]
MEHHLTRQAVEADEDVLRVLARRWEGVLDQDGQEPSEKVLRARQGVFLRGRRNGLHVMEIGATDEQFEQLVTVMNTATNPRGAAAATGQQKQSSNPVPLGVSEAVDGFEGAGSPTRPQNLLEGLVSACRIALSTEGLPATGGHRPQV